MKKILPILVLLLLIGCKPNQLITERTITKIDSTALLSFQDENKQLKREVVSLTSELERVRSENTKLLTEVSSHTINYDTGAQINPQTGKYPIASETMNQTKSYFERTIKELETQIQEFNSKIDELTTTNTKLDYTIDVLKNENKELKQKTTPTTGFNFRLFLLGVGLGIALSVIIYFVLKRYRIL